MTFLGHAVVLVLWFPFLVFLAAGARRWATDRRACRRERTRGYLGRRG